MRDYSELEQKIGYSFKNKALLKNALTHSSYVNENRDEGISDNERLEFFGDAIIEFVMSEYLFGKYPGLQEGDLTKMRASMVCEQGLAACAGELLLGEYLYMGKGESKSGGRERPSITSDAFEALTAAIYMDAGFRTVKKFIRNHLIDVVEHQELFFDAKTRLQEIIQKKGNKPLKYDLIAERGPLHNKTFEVAALLGGQEIGRGRGNSKKFAEQQAAQNALANIKNTRG